MKTVLLFSGGLNSTVLLYYLLLRDHNVKAVTVNYDQRHKIEIKHAVEIVDGLKMRGLAVNHHIMDAPDLRLLFVGTSQTSRSIPVPLAPYDWETTMTTAIPNFTMSMLGIAGSLAISSNADAVAMAMQGSLIPDRQPKIIAQFEGIFHDLTAGKLKLNCSLATKTRKEIIQIGAHDAVPFQSTYSCLVGKLGTHCGKCCNCLDRIAGFQLAGIADLTIYAA